MTKTEIGCIFFDLHRQQNYHFELHCNGFVSKLSITIANSRWTRDEQRSIVVTLLWRIYIVICAKFQWEKIIYRFFTLILLYLRNLCASVFEAHMNSPIKNRNSDILFQFFFRLMFLLLNISFHFLWMEFSVAFLCSASSIHLICLHDAFFHSRVNFVGMSEVDFKKISYLLASETANVYNWIFVFRFPLCWFIVCSILIRVIFASLFVGSQSSHFFSSTIPSIQYHINWLNYNNLSKPK